MWQLSNRGAPSLRPHSRVDGSWAALADVRREMADTLQRSLLHGQGRLLGLLDFETLVDRITRGGARHVVCNAADVDEHHGAPAQAGEHGIGVAERVVQRLLGHPEDHQLRLVGELRQAGDRGPADVDASCGEELLGERGERAAQAEVLEHVRPQVPGDPTGVSIRH